MAVETVTLFFALLAILAVVVAALVAVSWLIGDRFGIIAQLRPVALELATAVAVIATAGSLYLSEVEGYRPCRLCWIQRGFMYPAAVLLIVALVTKSRSAVKLAGLLAAIGLPIAIFHRYEQAAGDVGGFCDVDNPCTLRWVEQFGFVTIPTMAAAGFAAIAVLAVVALNHSRQQSLP